MIRSLIILSAFVFLLTACEKKDEIQVPQPPPQEESGTDRRVGEPGESPAESGQAPTVGQIREEREESATAGQPDGQVPTESAEKAVPTAPGGEGETEKKEIPADQDTPGAEKKDAATVKPDSQQKVAAEKTEAGAKAPETVVLPNKNGDITLPHQVHAELTDCKTCHGAAGPGKIELNRDSGHKLCLGCHKEQGAGPTGCSGCHKKSS